jgi:hypothetical protein
VQQLLELLHCDFETRSRNREQGRRSSAVAQSHQRGRSSHSSHRPTGMTFFAWSLPVFNERAGPPSAAAIAQLVDLVIRTGFREEVARYSDACDRMHGAGGRMIASHASQENFSRTLYHLPLARDELQCLGYVSI